MRTDWRSGATVPDESPHFACLIRVFLAARQHDRGVKLERWRMEMGRELARRFPVEADVVVAVPRLRKLRRSRFRPELNIPYGHAFVRNHYIGRHFCSRVKLIRDFDVRES